MQLQAESNTAMNTVTAYGQDYIEINAVAFKYAVFFSPESSIQRWDVQKPEDITAELLHQAAGLKQAKPDPMAFLDDAPPSKPADAPEVVLIGTGLKQHFLPHNVIQALLDLGIGVEAMSTQAAARTYNILMSEGRRVVAALLPLEPQT